LVYFERSREFRGEFFALLLFATAGMTLITAAADLIVVFLALEILSLSLYVLTGTSARLSSSEAAMKYFLLGAFSSAFFLYLIAYAVMVLGAFGVVMLVSGRGERGTSLSSYAGLSRTRPGLAALMTLFLLSLAGIPPTAGFIAKVDVFGAAVRAGHWPLVLIAVLGSVVATFFYLRVVVVMYMQAPVEEEAPAAADVPPAAATLPLLVPAVLTLA